MQLHIHPKTLVLKNKFTTSHGSVDERQAVIVELKEGSLSGFGEAVAISYYGKSQDKLIEDFNANRNWIASENLTDITDTFTQIKERNKDAFIRCALDNALHDLIAKKQKLKVSTRLGLTHSDQIISTLTVGIDTPENSAEFVRNNPWPRYKVKLGTNYDQQVIESIRQVSDAPILVDANSGWTLSKTIEISHWLKSVGVIFIEQPFKAEDRNSMHRIQGLSALPIIADESCHTPNDLDFCLRYFDGINIKLMKCGGISPALKMIESARSENKILMLGCMTESSIGISAAAQIASLFDYIDLDGAYLLKDDPATGVELQSGVIKYPDRNGHGGLLKNNLT